MPLDDGAIVLFIRRFQFRNTIAVLSIANNNDMTPGGCVAIIFYDILNYFLNMGIRLLVAGKKHRPKLLITRTNFIPDIISSFGEYYKYLFHFLSSLIVSRYPPGRF